MDKCWVVVADRCHARLFRCEAGQQLQEFRDLLNPDGRLKEQELVSDSPGHGLKRARGGRFAMSESVSHHDLVEQDFAHRIAELLIQSRQKGEVDRLHLVAAPHFLGLLRAGLDAPTRDRVASEVASNAIQLTPEALRELLPEHL